ncbi:thioredoxin family protein [Marinomonas transparens]|uniref:Thioredoxin family protein n=1 Tax=Marinomonas transparens TaxID=2795388 RepID=A0A934JR47_9GAMM|nr:thioredoxin family protein [Marinomonas transparens]MBJ7536721.1 thioredoxin family protein [Marinomonas transparens]
MKATFLGFNPEYAEAAPTFEEVSQLSGVALLEFGAPWCGYCQAARPAIEEVLNGASELSHIKVYDGKGKRLGRAFKVKLWLTLILLRDGQEVERLVRPVGSDEVRQLVSF